VNPVTGLVYGHVVASDLFGDIYVVPMDAMLAEIKATLGASSVSIEVSSFINTSRKLASSAMGGDSGYCSIDPSPAYRSANSPCRRKVVSPEVCGGPSPQLEMM